MKYKNQPRGIRNNNAGNIEWGDPWQGLVEQSKRTDPRFAQFVSPVWGVRALARTLITYQDKHKINTIRGIINRWAPPIENNTNAYIKAVAEMAGVSPDAKINLHNFNCMKPVLEGIIKHENGIGGLNTPNTWYSDDVIREGLRLAGIKEGVAHAGAIPVTKETVGATATAGLGVYQIAEVLPAIATSLERADGHLSSGSVVRIVIGIVSVVIAGFIAYSQIKRYRTETL